MFSLAALVALDVSQIVFKLGTVCIGIAVYSQLIGRSPKETALWVAAGAICAVILGNWLIALAFAIICVFHIRRSKMARAHSNK